MNGNWDSANSLMTIRENSYLLLEYIPEAGLCTPSIHLFTLSFIVFSECLPSLGLCIRPCGTVQSKTRGDYSLVEFSKC